MLVRGQRVWKRTRSAVVLDTAGELAVIELDSGAVEIVSEHELTPAEGIQSVKDREGGKD